jgi:hypothetical protein
LWLAETSQQPISQTTWLKVTPHCNHYNHFKPLASPPVLQHQAAWASAAAAPAPAPVTPDGEQAAATAEQQLASNSPSQQAKAERAELLAEEAANRRPIGRPEKDCYGLTNWLWGNVRGTAVMHRDIGTHEGEAMWQGEEEWEEGVAVEEDQRLRMQSRLEQPSS